MLIKIVAAI